MISPTGKDIRNDAKGCGKYGAPRGNRAHKGVDYLCEPGQDVVAPISGIIQREARPYADGEYSGVVIQGKHIAVKMFYFQPDYGLVGAYVRMGDVIGTAQDISRRYPTERDVDAMLPHVHVEIESMNVHALIEIFN